MVRRLLMVVAVVAFAILGAVLGRLVAGMRRQSAPAEEPHPDVEDALRVHPRDVVPGLVAALRVRDRPWSYLRIPSWFAAFSVNFAIAGLSRELAPLLRTLQGESPDDDREWSSPAPTSAVTAIRRGPSSTPGFHPFDE